MRSYTCPFTILSIARGKESDELQTGLAMFLQLNYCSHPQGICTGMFLDFCSGQHCAYKVRSVLHRMSGANAGLTLDIGVFAEV